MADKTTDVQIAIAEECDALKELLLEKNRAYGNSALDPVRIFSKADATEQIRVRIDDKLSRLARGSSAGEDVELDLMGYLVLLRVARRRQSLVVSGETLDKRAADVGVQRRLGETDEGLRERVVAAVDAIAAWKMTTRGES